MTGVIIAAGKGERLSNITGGKPKTLLVINGKPIIQWIVDELSASGVEKVLIVTGYQSEKIKHYFKINPHENIKFVYNNLWEKGNGISVLSVGKLVKKESEFLLMMSDHLIGRKVIKDIIKEKKRCPLLAVEKKLGKVFDIIVFQMMIIGSILIQKIHIIRQCKCGGLDEKYYTRAYIKKAFVLFKVP